MANIKQPGSVEKANYLTFPHNLFTALTMFLFLAGCKARSALPSSSPTLAEPTSTASSFQIPETTDSPLPPIEPPGNSSEPLQIETKTYSHPDDLFVLQVPESWEAKQGEYGASFSDPQGKATLNVYAVNTGYPLDRKSFQKLADAWESNTYSDFDDFIEIFRQENATDHSLHIQKQFSNSGDPKIVETLYYQQDQAVLILDFWSDQRDFESYQEVLKKVAESVSIDVEAVSVLGIYSSAGEKFTQDGYFSLVIPPYWGSKQSSGEETIVNTFSSPDEQAYLQAVIYDDGQPLSRTVAGNIVRTMLRENYTKDIVVTSDLLIKGREQLEWKSIENNYQGVTWFETRGTTLLALTAMWNSEMGDTYQTTLENMTGTFQPLPSEGG